MKRTNPWGKLLQRQLRTLTRRTVHSGTQALKQAMQTTARQRKPPAGEGDWIAGVSMGATGARRWRLYRPPGVGYTERLPLMVMLHGCGQDAASFARATRMNRVAARERFFVLYPEQDRLANPQGCWNWFDTRSGRAQGEAALVLAAIDQVLLLYPVDRERVALAGLSAGASLAALLASREPRRFKALVMHSGVPPGAAESTAQALAAMRGRRAPAAAAAAWPPLLVIQGGRDHVVAAVNARNAAQLWADAAGAEPGPARAVQRGQRHAMAVTDFKRGSRAVATLCELPALGHAWSGGAAGDADSDAQGPDASRMAWAFALRQFNRPG